MVRDDKSLPIRGTSRVRKSARRRDFPQNAAKQAAQAPLAGPGEIQAIYDAFVRIWRDEGWAGITTRAVALDTGISVGTLYDYFPNKRALLSGYMRHALEVLLDRIEREVVQASGLDWETRVRRLVRLSCGVGPNLPHIDREMLTLVDEIAEPKHHRRVFEELSTIWCRAIGACKDIPEAPDRRAVVSLFAAVWGARRYLALVEPRQFDRNAWVSEMERLCCARLVAR